MPFVVPDHECTVLAAPVLTASIHIPVHIYLASLHCVVAQGSRVWHHNSQQQTLPSCEEDSTYLTRSLPDILLATSPCGRKLLCNKFSLSPNSGLRNRSRRRLGLGIAAYDVPTSKRLSRTSNRTRRLHGCRMLVLRSILYCSHRCSIRLLLGRGLDVDWRARWGMLGSLRDIDDHRLVQAFGALLYSPL